MRKDEEMMSRVEKKYKTFSFKNSSLFIFSSSLFICFLRRQLIGVGTT